MQIRSKKLNYASKAKEKQLVYKLAMENNHEEIEKILKKSDDLDHINGCMVFALCGYAEGNHTDSLNSTLDKCLALSKEGSLALVHILENIILGYARSNNGEQVSSFLSKAKEELKSADFFHCQLKAVEGYADYNHQEKVESIFLQASSKDDLLKLKENAIMHYDDIQVLEKVHEQETDPELIKIIRERLAECLIQEGFFKKAVSLIITQRAENKISNMDTQDDLREYAIGIYISIYKNDKSFDKLKFIIEFGSEASNLDKYWREAAEKYAELGDVTFVNQCINQIKSSDNLTRSKISIAFQYLKTKNAEAINDLIAMDNKIVRASINKNYLFPFLWEYQNNTKEDVIQFIKCIDNQEMREFCIDTAIKENVLQKDDTLKKSFADFNQYMRKHNFTYSQAMCWKQPSHVLFWFLQGIQLVKENKIPSEIYFLISTYLLNCDTKKAIAYLDDHFKIIPDSLRAVSTQTLCSKRFGTQFNLFPNSSPTPSSQPLTQEKFETGLRKINEKYLYRTNLFAATDAPNVNRKESTLPTSTNSSI